MCGPREQAEVVKDLFVQPDFTGNIVITDEHNSVMDYEIKDGKLQTITYGRPKPENHTGKWDGLSG